MDPLFWHIRLVLLYIKIIYTFQIYGICAPFRNKIPKFLYGPSITHKDDHFTKKCKINLINYNKDMKSDSKNTLWYNIKLITMGDNSWNLSWLLQNSVFCIGHIFIFGWPLSMEFFFKP